MKKAILEIYALAVCFVAVMCFAAFFSLGTYNVIQMLKPEFTMNDWVYEIHQTNDAYWKHSRNTDGGDGENTQPRPDEATLSRQRQESFARAQATEAREGARSLVKSLIFLLADLVVFSSHWVIGRRARAE